jgi:hypothetical protein
MKAFLMSIAALAVITVVSAVVLNVLPGSASRDVYTDKANVRL